jgi:hypothetical protein
VKTPEYIEGTQALENFERGMTALFKVPKAAIERAEKKKRKHASPRVRVRKPKKSGKD